MKSCVTFYCLLVSTVFIETINSQDALFVFRNNINTFESIDLSDFQKITFNQYGVNLYLNNSSLLTVDFDDFNKIVFRNPQLLDNTEKMIPVYIYPNPAIQSIQFRNTRTILPDFNIFNLTGQKVLSGVLHNSDEVIQLNGINPGIYIIVIENQRIKFLLQ